MESFTQELERAGLIEFYSLLCPGFSSSHDIFSRNTLSLPPDDSKSFLMNPQQPIVSMKPFDEERVPIGFFKGIRATAFIAALSA